MPQLFSHHQSSAAAKPVYPNTIAGSPTTTFGSGGGGGTGVLGQILGGGFGVPGVPGFAPSAFGGHIPGPDHPLSGAAIGAGSPTGGASGGAPAAKSSMGGGGGKAVAPPAAITSSGASTSLPWMSRLSTGPAGVPGTPDLGGY